MAKKIVSIFFKLLLLFALFMIVAGMFFIEVKAIAVTSIIAGAILFFVFFAYVLIFAVDTANKKAQGVDV